jgi:hypothetical protein
MINKVLKFLGQSILTVLAIRIGNEVFDKASEKLKKKKDNDPEADSRRPTPIRS